MAEKHWKIPKVQAPDYDREQRGRIAAYEEALAVQLSAKPARLEHSLSVARTAEAMAVLYGEDAYEARVAGILHDWAKAYDDDAQRARAERYGVDLGVDPALVTNLYHGMVAARELPERWPELSASVLQAIDRHTTGAADMTPLDMIVFVADGIEPRRKDVQGIRRVREMVERRAPLADVFWESFRNGVVYVLQTDRYLWPGTLSTYNALALARARG